MGRARRMRRTDSRELLEILSESNIATSSTPSTVYSPTNRRRRFIFGSVFKYPGFPLVVLTPDSSLRLDPV